LANKRHLYVFDTCVLLHDPKSIFKFGTHDIYLPLAVIDDLDNIKSRREPVARAARQVFRILKDFPQKDLLNKGVTINPENGRLFIYNHEPIGEIVRTTDSDNKLIATCLALKESNPKHKVILVTRDMGLSIRATLHGCECEYYGYEASDTMYKGVRYVHVTDSEDWNLIWKSKEFELGAFSLSITDQLNELGENEFVVFQWGSQSCPAQFVNGVLKSIKDDFKDKKPTKGIVAENLEQKFAFKVLCDDSIQFVTLCGKAGTGKTIVTLATALHKLEQGDIEKIVVIKPIVPVGGKDIGALPGDKYEKLASWLGPIKDNIEQLGQTSFEDYVREGAIEVEAMTYIQGRSIPNSFIIIDESQNLTAREARMIVERCGRNSKIVLLGDLSQIENTNVDPRSSGLAHAIQGSKKHRICATVTLSKVERSELASIASDIFNSPEAML
jgi:PhoH-like ATPase